MLVHPEQLEGQRVRLRGFIDYIPGFGAALYASRWDRDFVGSRIPTPSLHVGIDSIAPGSDWSVRTAGMACHRMDVVIEGTIRTPPPDPLAPAFREIVHVTRIESLTGEPYLYQPGVWESLIAPDKGR